LGGFFVGGQELEALSEEGLDNILRLPESGRQPDQRKRE